MNLYSVYSNLLNNLHLIFSIASFIFSFYSLIIITQISYSSQKLKPITNHYFNENILFNFNTTSTTVNRDNSYRNSLQHCLPSKDSIINNKNIPPLSDTCENTNIAPLNIEFKDNSRIKQELENNGEYTSYYSKRSLFSIPLNKIKEKLLLDYFPINKNNKYSQDMSSSQRKYTDDYAVELKTGTNAEVLAEKLGLKFMVKYT